MRTYTAHLRPGREPKLLREGWTWLGFLFGPLWLLATGAWIPGLLVAAADALIVGLLPAALSGPPLVGLAVLMGLLGRDMRRWSLALGGRPTVHVIVARDEFEALRRLYEANPAAGEAAL